MTTFLQKIGTQAETVYLATSFLTDSLYSAVTDNAVFPASKWIWTKLGVAEHPKVKNFFQADSLYRTCRSIKQATYEKAHAKPFKNRGLEQYNCLGQMMDYNLEVTDKVLIQAARYLYVIADVGEKTVAVRLFAVEMAPQLRPSLNQHFVRPILADINHAKPETLGGLILGVVVEEGGAALVDGCLISAEKQINAKVTEIENTTQAQAISWFSNTVLREGLNTFVTPAVVSGLLSLTGYAVEVVSITTAGSYLETVRTTAYAISFLQYANCVMWAVKAGKAAYQLHQSYTPETGNAMKLLRESLTRPNKTTENSFDPTRQIKNYSAVVAAECNLPALAQQMIKKTGLSRLSDSSLQKHVRNFTDDIRAKSETALRKYELIDSDVFYDALEELPDPDIFYECDEALFLASNAPEVTTTDAAAAVAALAGVPTPSTPPSTLLGAAVLKIAEAGLGALKNASSPPTPPASTAPMKADDAEKQLSWIRRIAATVCRVASAILTFLRKLPPSFHSKLFKISPNVATLLRYFTLKPPKK